MNFLIQEKEFGAFLSVYFLGFFWEGFYSMNMIYYSSHEPDAGGSFAFVIGMVGYLIIVGYVSLIGMTLGIQSWRKDRLNLNKFFNATILGCFLSGGFFIFAVSVCVWLRWSLISPK